MYTAHFGFTEAPFAVTPDPRYLYMSDGHREALAHLLYGIGEGGGFVQLTGEVGTGKTTLCRCLLEQLPSHVDVALILNPRLTDTELLAALCDELRVTYPAGTTSRKLLVDLLYRYLLDAHARKRRTVLIVDEAQDLAPEVLEQIRLLTNLETTTEKLLQIILIGQPELIGLLEREDLRQLAQRVTARYHLLPFSEGDTVAYVRHRMEVAGQKSAIFTDGALRQVRRLSRGVPRLINAICDRALLGAYSRGEPRVDAGTVRRAAAEVLGRPAPRRSLRPWQWMVAAVAVVALASAAVLLTDEQARMAGSRLVRNRVRPIVAAGPPAPTPVPSGPGAAADGAAAPAGGSVATAPVAGGLAPASIAAAPVVAAVDEVATAHELRPAAGRPVSLSDILSDRSVRADKRSAFASLYARWGVDFTATPAATGCERGRPEGLRCLFGTGTWAKLRRIDLPAIIELTSKSWERRYATVVALDDRTVTLDIGGRRHVFPLSEVDLHWDGPFILLWKAPALGAQPIEPGRRSKDVAWVKDRLGELDGTPVDAKDRDLFDDELRARLIAFQRSRSLVPDGLVGDETLIHLTFAPRDHGVPRLSQAGS